MCISSKIPKYVGLPMLPQHNKRNQILEISKQTLEMSDFCDIKVCFGVIDPSP